MTYSTCRVRARTHRWGLERVKQEPAVRASTHPTIVGYTGINNQHHWMDHAMRQSQQIKVIVVIVVLLVVVVLPLSKAAFWDGHFQLDVELCSRTSTQPTIVSYGLYNRDVADYVVQNIDEFPEELQTAENVDNGRFVVSVPCSGREWLGMSYGYAEPFRFIVLQLKYNDKDRFCTVAEIPEGRGPRNLRVDVP